MRSFLRPLLTGTIVVAALVSLSRPAAAEEAAAPQIRSARIIERLPLGGAAKRTLGRHLWSKGDRLAVPAGQSVAIAKQHIERSAPEHAEAKADGDAYLAAKAALDQRGGEQLLRKSEATLAKGEALVRAGQGLVEQNRLKPAESPRPVRIANAVAKVLPTIGKRAVGRALWWTGNKTIAVTEKYTQPHAERALSSGAKFTKEAAVNNAKKPGADTYGAFVGVNNTMYGEKYRDRTVTRLANGAAMKQAGLTMYERSGGSKLMGQR